MMKKLITLVLVLAFVAPALADDVIPAWWANDGLDNRIMPTGQDPCDPARWTGPEQLQGSTYSQWTYDDPCNVYGPYGAGGWDEADWPDNSWFVSHPEKVDPWHEIGGEQFSGQWWGSDDDPCVADWVYTAPFSGERTGHINFLFGSWDLSNFEHDQPAKDMWVQITYFNGTDVATDIDYAESGYNYQVPGDPCGEPWGSASVEAPLSEWDYEAFGDPMETWEEEGEVLAWSEYEETLANWDPCSPWGEPMETWDTREPSMTSEEYVDAERVVAGQQLGDGWLLDVFSVEYPVNPWWEYFEVGYVDTILIDQVIIETLCYVPEPATMVLLGLGSLLMIRRKR